MLGLLLMSDDRPPYPHTTMECLRQMTQTHHHHFDQIDRFLDMLVLSRGTIFSEAEVEKFAECKKQFASLNRALINLVYGDSPPAPLTAQEEIILANFLTPFMKLDTITSDLEAHEAFLNFSEHSKPLLEGCKNAADAILKTWWTHKVPQTGKSLEVSVTETFCPGYVKDHPDWNAPPLP